MAYPTSVMNPYVDSYLPGEYETPETHQARILVVDDDASLVNLLKEFFQAEGYQVSCGFDGQMAIHLARQEHPDLILLDVNMPLTNGLKAFTFLRQRDETKQIPVIFVSGELSKEISPVVMESPRVAHLKKPMDLEHLSSMVRQFIKQYPVAR